MWIRRIDRERLHQAYGIGCQDALPEGGGSAPPFGASWCVVGPGGTARSHRHQEHEVFLIASGHGEMTVDGETETVGPGDVVLMEPFDEHELRNLSNEDELVFVDLLWERLPEASRISEAHLEAARGPVAGRVLITATPPTPNGDLHVGHLAGPYLSADIHRRYLALRGADASYLSGVDDHQSYVEVAAQANGTMPDEVVRRMGDRMEATLRAAGIRLDHFARPRRSPHHERMVQELFGHLHETGAIVARDAPTLYCESCERHLFEGHVQGRCGHCGSSCDGNVCESCGWPNDCVDLGETRCRHCGRQPAIRTCRRLYFPLAPWAERLAAYYERVRMGPHLRALCEDMLRRGLPDIAVSQVSDWGVRVPVPGFEDQAIYVWLEMAPGYLAATEELTGDWRRYWASDDARVVQFFGFDNGYFHAVLFPALYMAADPEIRLPDAFVTNEFYRYEGSKFSTSRNHALWGRELFERVPTDPARFYLAWDRPETEQRDFWLRDLEAVVDRELTGAWDPWLRDLGDRLRRHFGGEVPGTGAWTAEHQAHHRDLLATVAEVGSCYEAEEFSPPRAVRLQCELVRRVRRFAAAEAHWAKLPGRFEEWRTAIALEALSAKVLAMLVAPVMPGFAARLWSTLGLGEGPPPGGWEEIPELLPAGTRAASLERPWFPAAPGVETVSSPGASEPVPSHEQERAAS